MTAQPQADTMNRRSRALAAALFIPPMAVLANLEIAYALVPAACDWQNALPLHLVNVFWLVLALGGGLIAWRNSKTPGPGRPEGQGAALERSRFIAEVALLLSGLCVLVLLAQWMAMFLLDPCQ